MGLAKLNAWVDDVLSHGWVPPKVISVSDLLKQCELTVEKITLEKITRRSMSMGSMLSDLDPNLPTITETYSEKCQPPLKPLEHDLERVKHDLDSLETRRRDLDEECIILGADVGPCLDDVQTHEVNSHVPQVDLLHVVDKGKAKFSVDTSSFEGEEQTIKGISSGLGVNGVPSTCKGGLNPWVMIENRTKVSPFGLKTLCPEKMNPGAKMVLEGMETKSHRRHTPNTKHSEVIDIVMSPLKVTLGQKGSHCLGLTPRFNTFEEATHGDDNYDWGGLNEEGTPRTCLLCVGLLYDTIEGLKFHNFTPHFHHYMLLRLLVCLASLGSMVYI